MSANLLSAYPADKFKYKLNIESVEARHRRTTNFEGDVTYTISVYTRGKSSSLAHETEREVSSGEHNYGVFEHCLFDEDGNESMILSASLYKYIRAAK